MKKILIPILIAIATLAVASCHCKGNDTKFEDPNAGNSEVYGDTVNVK